MSLYPKQVDKYLRQYTKPRSQLLEDLDRRTYIEMLMPQMISGHVQGNLLSFLIHLSKAKHVLEIGTFTGYATICIAQALDLQGRVTTIEKNPEFKAIANSFWEKANLRDKIDQHIGNASDIIESLEGPWDFVFIDAAKKEYSRYFDLVFPKLKQGGLILADNVLWSGKVIYEPNDPISKKLHTFNEKITKDPRVENLIVPLRDGIHLIRKISD